MPPKIGTLSHPSDETASSTRSPKSEEYSGDTIFHILQTSRRRETIRYLLDNDGPVKMRDIAEHVAAVEHETTVGKLDSTQRQRVYIPLYQSHLPTLDEEEIIEYNKNRGIVQPTDKLELFRPHLEIKNGKRSDTQDQEENTPRTDWTTILLLSSTCVNVLLASIVGVYAAVSEMNTGFLLIAVISALIAIGITFWTARRNRFGSWFSNRDLPSAN